MQMNLSFKNIDLKLILKTQHLKRRKISAFSEKNVLSIFYYIVTLLTSSNCEKPEDRTTDLIYIYIIIEYMRCQ